MQKYNKIIFSYLYFIIHILLITSWVKSSLLLHVSNCFHWFYNGVFDMHFLFLNEESSDPNRFGDYSHPFMIAFKIYFRIKSLRKQAKQYPHGESGWGMVVGRLEQVLELQQAQEAVIKRLMGTYKVKWGIMGWSSLARVLEPKQVI